MPVSLTSSIDIIANSVSVVQKIVNILDTISQISGLAPETLDTLQELAQSINNDNTFYNTINNQLVSKANSADVYTQLQTFSQTEINNKLSEKQDSITLTSSLTLSAITLTGSVIVNKIIANYYEPTTGGTFMNFNISSTAVVALTATLIRLMQHVQIDQGCKIQNNLSLGSYSP